MKRFWLVFALAASLMMPTSAFAQAKKSYGSGTSAPKAASPAPKPPSPKPAPTPKPAPVAKAAPAPVPVSAPKKSYGSGSPTVTPSVNPSVGAKPNTSGIDSGASRAQKETISAQNYQNAQKPIPAPAPVRTAAKPPTRTSTPTSSTPAPQPTVYVDRRVYYGSNYDTYRTRPAVVYHDNYDSVFWYYLLDQSLDVQAMWAYNHRYDMDQSRYNALLAQNSALSNRIYQLESQNIIRDPYYAPSGFDNSAMYVQTSAPMPSQPADYGQGSQVSGRSVLNVFIWIGCISVAIFFAWFIFFREAE